MKAFLLRRVLAAELSALDVRENLFEDLGERGMEGLDRARRRMRE
jgi:hypothetical protein